MAGEIASAYLAILPSMRGFGTGIVQQGGPQIALAGKQLGQQGGVALGAALGGSAAKGAIPALNQVNSAITAVQANTQGWLSTTSSMAIKNVAIYGSMYAAIQGVRQGLNAMFDAMVGFNAELEQSDIGFTTLLGSAAAAKEQMSWIKDFAKETPFNFKDLVGYSQQLIALGFNAEESRKVLAATGDAAAALGRGSESIQRINLALGQMWTKGKVQSQEMLQLTEAGIGAWKILADAYGASVADVQDAVTKGLISAQDAVPALIAGMETQFGGLMDAQSKTFSGMVSNIQDTLQQELAAAGEPLFRVLVEQAQQFLDALDDPQAVEMMQQLGDALATGADALAGFVKFAWEWRDVLLAVGVGYAALRLAQSQVVNAAMGTGMVTQLAQWKAMPAALMGARAATVASTAANRAALTASIDLGVAKHTEAQATIAAATAAKTATDAATRGTVASRASWAAQKDLAVATQARLAANTQFVVSENAAAVATERATAATQARAAAMSKLGGALSTVGAIAGAALLFDGWSKAAKQATSGSDDLGQSVANMVESIGGGAAIGAYFGSTVLPGLGTAAGAAGGAVVGLVGNLWSMSAAMQAANADTSIAKDALQSLGVEATLASLALGGITNDQLEAAGGFDAIRKAMQAGTYSEYVVDLKSQSAAMRDQADALETQLNAMEKVAAKNGASGDLVAGLGDAGKAYRDLTDAMNVLLDQAGAVDGAVKALAGNSDYLASAQDQVVFSAYQAAFAADLQTGALGRQTAAAWEAIAAEGGLGAEALQAALRMEGLAGVAGYVTQMISGIPTGTAINFSTNAADIALQITNLRAAAEAGFSSLGMTADGYVRQMQSLQAKYAAALGGVSTRLTLPTGGGGRAGGGGSAASAVSKAAQDAARQLEQDRNAQLRFGDAFGVLMESALGGNFDQYRDKLADQIKSLTRDGYTKAADELKRLSSTLTQAALDYGALTNKIKAASDAESDLTKRMRDQYQASVDLVMGLGKATDAQSFDQLAYLLGETASAATQYQDVLQRLKDEGLSDELWNQLAQAGPESMGLAQSILAQGAAGVEQLNSLSGGLADAATSMGDIVANSMYQQGVDAMQAYIDGLKSQAAALENQLVTIGNNVLSKTAGAITPGNAGYSPITNGSQTTANTYQVSLSVNASNLGDLQKIQDFIQMLESAPTTQLVDAAGKVTS